MNFFVNKDAGVRYWRRDLYDKSRVSRIFSNERNVATNVKSPTSVINMIATGYGDPWLVSPQSSDTKVNLVVVVHHRSHTMHRSMDWSPF